MYSLWYFDEISFNRLSNFSFDTGIPFSSINAKYGTNVNSTAETGFLTLKIS